MSFLIERRLHRTQKVEFNVKTSEIEIEPFPITNDKDLYVISHFLLP